MKDITEQTTQVSLDSGIFVTISLPVPFEPVPGFKIVLQQGDRVQWLYEEQFSVSLPGNVFNQTSLLSYQQNDGSFLTETATVIGSPGTSGECTYALEVGSPDSHDPSNPPPPPNDIIVDSSTPKSLERLRLELIERVKGIEADHVKRLIDAINDVLKISSGNSQPETENRNGRTPR